MGNPIPPAPETDEDGRSLRSLYRHRFDQGDRAAKNRVWTVLCERVFSRYVRPSDTVIDIGAGYCEFINHIQAARRIAIDANPELPQFAAPGVETITSRAEDVPLRGGIADVAFSSNFFEHLPDKATLFGVVQAIHRLVKPGGTLLVMGPNVKYLPGEYWDYFDHHIPLTEKSVEELLHLAGFEVIESLPRFMPYTVKSRLPTWDWLVRAYLALGALSFRFFGKQFLVVARKRDG